MIDLFSGCGGFSYGFEQAGFECLVGVDQDGAALQTFKHNHKNAKALQLDLSKDENISVILDEIEGKKIDLIAGGPPCQGFSLTGTRRENDSRNSLFRSMFRLAEKVNPAFIVLENVGYCQFIRRKSQTLSMTNLVDCNTNLTKSSSTPLIMESRKLGKECFLLDVRGSINFRFLRQPIRRKNM